MAVVVLPTPPFWLATAMTRPMILFSACCASAYAKAFAKINARLLCKTRRVFHVKHSNSFARLCGGANLILWAQCFM